MTQKNHNIEHNILSLCVFHRSPSCIFPRLFDEIDFVQAFSNCDGLKKITFQNVQNIHSFVLIQHDINNDTNQCVQTRVVSSNQLRNLIELKM